MCSVILAEETFGQFLDSVLCYNRMPLNRAALDKASPSTPNCLQVPASSPAVAELDLRLAVAFCC